MYRNMDVSILYVCRRSLVAPSKATACWWKQSAAMQMSSMSSLFLAQCEHQFDTLQAGSGYLQDETRIDIFVEIDC